ncbi:MAG: hypothetical protein H6825_14905 [Planctomycetes bacterium]|nr:hypothetical protein [Planctomycetota bacterium]
MHAALLVGLSCVVGCVGERAAVDHRGVEGPRLAAMARALGVLDEARSAAIAPTGVTLPFFEDVDEAVLLQGIAVLTGAYLPEDAQQDSVRVVVVALDAVVNLAGETCSRLVSSSIQVREVECAGTAPFEFFFTLDLDVLPDVARVPFSESTLASPMKRHVLRMRPRGDLTWGDVERIDQVDLTVEERDV